MSTTADGVLAAIVALTAEKGYPPTVREIGEAVGLTSMSSVHAHLRTLVRQGRIRNDPERPRTIQVLLHHDERPADHLTETTSDRGFRRLPPIPGAYGGTVRVYESSAAIGPHLWLVAEAHGDSDSDQPLVIARLHLTAEDTWRLADQLRHLVEGHYQGDARPEWAR